MFSPCFVMQYLFCDHLAVVKIAGCLTVIVFVLWCEGYCSCLFIMVPWVSL